MNHHAYVIAGREEVLPQLKEHIEKKLGITFVNNPDALMLEHESLGIDDARQVRDRQGRRGVGESGKKVFVLVFDFATREAQNALLKVLEEPTEGTYFFLLTPTPETLLPTLRSRLSPLVFGNIGAPERIAVSSFLKATPAQRLAMIRVFVDENERGVPDKPGAIAFLTTLEEYLAGTQDIREKKTREALRVVAQARDYLHDTAPSVKMLLEHVALVV